MGKGVVNPGDGRSLFREHLCTIFRDSDKDCIEEYRRSSGKLKIRFDTSAIRGGSSSDFRCDDFEVGSELQGGFLERYDDIGVGPVSNQAADNAALERLLCFRWMLSAGDFGRSHFAGTSPSVKNYVQQEDTLHPDLSLYGAQSYVRGDGGPAGQG